MLFLDNSFSLLLKEKLCPSSLFIWISFFDSLFLETLSKLSRLFVKLFIFILISLFILILISLLILLFLLNSPGVYSFDLFVNNFFCSLISLLLLFWGFISTFSGGWTVMTWSLLINILLLIPFFSELRDSIGLIKSFLELSLLKGLSSRFFTSMGLFAWERFSSPPHKLFYANKINIIIILTHTFT